MKGLIQVVIDYAWENNLLPMTGNQLFHLQDEAIKALNTETIRRGRVKVRLKFGYTPRKWIGIMMDRIEVDNENLSACYKAIRDHEKEVLGFVIPEAAYRYNYWYDRLKNAARLKKPFLTRKMINGVYHYDIKID